MSKFADSLWRDLVREHAETLAHTERPAAQQTGRTRRSAGSAMFRRPRVLASSTLGLAVVGAALVLTLSGTAATAPAYAITTGNDGSVLVKINSGKSFIDADRALALQHGEVVVIDMTTGPATVAGAVNCGPRPGVPRAPGPAVRVLVGKDGTQVIKADDPNTGAVGSFHLAACYVQPSDWSGNTGNTSNTGN